MSDNPFFQLWVANTIASLGGNGALYLEGLRGKCVLTCAEIRMAACQGGFDRPDEWFSLDLMRPSVIAPANLTMLH